MIPACDGLTVAETHKPGFMYMLLAHVQVQHPTVWSHDEWIHSFDRFLNAIHVRDVHIYGVSLGAYLAQVLVVFTLSVFLCV